MNELALFCGAGGGLLGSRLLGWTTVAAVEIEEYPRRVVLQRQRDKTLDRFPLWDDVSTFDGKPWRGVVDVITGGFPCQDISAAGKGQGLAGSRSSLWFEMLRIIDEVRPRYVFAENSPNLRTRGLGVVIQGLTGLGYDVRWGVLGAGHAGAPHQRKRMWIYASDPNQESVWLPDKPRREAPSFLEHDGPPQHVADTDQEGPQGQPWDGGPTQGWQEQTGHAASCGVQARADQDWWATEPSVGRVVDGVASRVDRLKALGNGQVPAVAALAWEVLGGE